MNEQIFISYRREGGVSYAKLICEALKNHGYTVFFDFDSIRGGFFDERIFDAIDACKDFILVLPENSLDRCANDDDWVRKEISYAIKKEKNIIPVMLEGFKFPVFLPDDIAKVSRFNGVPMVMKYFDTGVMPDIIDHLISKPLYNPLNSLGESSLIRSVCSFGSCDLNNPNPSDAYYSEIIDRDRYNIVYFRITTVPITNKTTLHTRITVYDSQNNAAYEEFSKIDWNPNNHEITIPWVIKKSDGSYFKSGKYRAVFQIDNSNEYEYEFEIISASASSTHNNANLPEIKKLERNLAFPKAFLFHLLSSICFSISIILFSTGLETQSGFGLVLLIVSFVLWVKLFNLTRKKICESLLLTLLVMTIGISYYGLFITAMAIANIFMAKKWKKRLTEITK